MADRRRRRRPTASESEYSETDEKRSPKKEASDIKKDSDCESEDDHGEGSEYESATEENEEDDYTYTEDYSEDDSSVLIEDEYIEDDWVSQERQSGDGEEQPDDIDKELDDDEDRKNPAFVPRKGNFYEHDRREDEEGVEEEGVEVNQVEEKETERAINKKKLWEESKKWDHDRFDDRMQAPKSREELIALYGYDIRDSDKPPEELPARRGSAPRGRRSENRPKFGDYMEGRFENPRTPRYGPRAVQSPRGGRGGGSRGRYNGGGRGQSRGRGRGMPNRGEPYGPNEPPPREWRDEQGQGDRRAYSNMKSERHRVNSGEYDQNYQQTYNNRQNDQNKDYNNYVEGQEYNNRKYRGDGRGNHRNNQQDGRGRIDRYSPKENSPDNYRSNQDSNNSYQNRRYNSGRKAGSGRFSNDVRQDPRFGNNNYRNQGNSYNRNDGGYNDRRSKSKTPERKANTQKTDASMENILEIAPPLTTIETRTTATVHTAMTDTDGRNIHGQDRRKKGMRTRLPEDDRPESQKKPRDLPEKPPRFREQEQAKQQTRERGGFGQPPPSVAPNSSNTGAGKPDGRQTKRYSSLRQRNVPEADNPTPPPGAMTMVVSQTQAVVTGGQIQPSTAMGVVTTQPRIQGPHSGSGAAVPIAVGNAPVSGPRPAPRGPGIPAGPRMVPQYFVQQAGQVFPAGAVYRVVSPPNVSEPKSPPSNVKPYPPHLLQQQAIALQGSGQLRAAAPATRMVFTTPPGIAQGQPPQSISIATVTGAPRVIGQQGNPPQYIAAAPLVNIAAAGGPPPSAAGGPPQQAAHFPISGQVPVQFPVPPPPVRQRAEVATVTTSAGQGQIRLAPPQGQISAPQGQIPAAAAQIPSIGGQGQIPAQALAGQPPAIPGQPPALPGQSPAIHVRGGTTYFNPQIQMFAEGRSPARRTKEPIPIVSPQGTPNRPGIEGEDGVMYYEVSDSLQYELIQQQYDATHYAAAYNAQQFPGEVYVEGTGYVTIGTETGEIVEDEDGAVQPTKSSSLENLLKQSGSLDNIKEFHPQQTEGHGQVDSTEDIYDKDEQQVSGDEIDNSEQYNETTDQYDESETLQQDVESETLQQDVESETLQQDVESETSQQVVESETLQQDVESETLQQDVESETLQQDVESETSQQVVESETLQQVIESESMQQVTDPESYTLQQVTEAESESLHQVMEKESETLQQVTETESETMQQVTETESETLQQVTETESETLQQVTESESNTITAGIESAEELTTEQGDEENVETYLESRSDLLEKDDIFQETIDEGTDLSDTSGNKTTDEVSNENNTEGNIVREDTDIVTSGPESDNEQFYEATNEPETDDKSVNEEEPNVSTQQETLVKYSSEVESVIKNDESQCIEDNVVEVNVNTEVDVNKDVNEIMNSRDSDLIPVTDDINNPNNESETSNKSETSDCHNETDDVNKSDDNIVNSVSDLSLNDNNKIDKEDVDVKSVDKVESEHIDNAST